MKLNTSSIFHFTSQGKVIDAFHVLMLVHEPDGSDLLHLQIFSSFAEFQMAEKLKISKRVCNIRETNENAVF